MGENDGSHKQKSAINPLWTLNVLMLLLVCSLRSVTAALAPKPQPHDDRASRIWTGRRCTFVRVHVDRKAPEEMGWALQPAQGAAAGGVVNGSWPASSYSASLAGKKVCHMVVLPNNVQQFELLLQQSSKRQWQGGQVGLASDPFCSRFQYTSSNPLAVTKEAVGPSERKRLPSEFETWPCEVVAPQHFQAGSGIPMPMRNDANKRPGATPLSPSTPGASTPRPPSNPAPFLINAAQECPARPEYRPPGTNGPKDAGCGPDMMPLMETITRDGELFAMRECWQKKTPVRFDVMDPFNPRYQSYCQAIEANLTDGCYTVLRFSTGVANRGNCDLYLGNPVAEAANGSTTYEWADCHKHWHWKNFATYEIFDPLTDMVSRAAKTGFCALDSDDLPNRYGVARGGEQQRVANKGATRFDSCGEFNMTGCQGVSVGRADVYDYTLSGQFFCIDGCRSGQPPLQWGKQYTIRITTNPPYEPTSTRDPCFVDDSGQCHRFYELDYSNNVLEWTFTLTQDLLKAAVNSPDPFIPTQPIKLPGLPADADWLKRANQALIVRQSIPRDLGLQFVNGRPIDPLQILPSSIKNSPSPKASPPTQSPSPGPSPNRSSSTPGQSPSSPPTQRFKVPSPIPGSPPQRFKFSPSPSQVSPSPSRGSPSPSPRGPGGRRLHANKDNEVRLGADFH